MPRHPTFVMATAFAALALPAAAFAAPQFAKVFGDHAVLQRDKPIEVWGTAAPGEQVTVELTGADGSFRPADATADPTGKWRATLGAMPAGTGYSLNAIDASGKATLNDIAVGDVFFCGGQSNMEFPEKLATGAWGDIANSANPNMRFVIIPKASEAALQDEVKADMAWKVVGPDTVGEASAVCYQMAKAVQKQVNVPFGMIDSYWGGTAIQSWISDGNLRTLPQYVEGLDTIALLARDPSGAYAEQSKREEAWWDAHDPSNKKNRDYIAANYNDSAWATLPADRGWKESGVDGLKDFDGVAWLRTTVTLTADQAKTANELTLGSIDTFDSTWVNGNWVGSSSTSWLWREYKVPAGVFKAGVNVITIRALGGGGLTGKPEFRFVKTSDGQSIPITGTWKIKPGMRATGLSLPAAPWAIPNSLTTLYNGMVSPVAGYGVKLAAWYQGESNTWQPAEYRTLLPLLMKDWRQTFNDPALPFFVVQLSSYGPVATKPGTSDWAELREAQRQAVNADAHAGLAVTIDYGDRSDIHPTQKTIVGQRLARAALSVAYGQAITPTGPDAVSATRSGGDIVVSFRYTNGGLQTYSSNDAIGFEVCSAPDICTYAPGTVAGDTVVLKGADSPAVTSVRYAWANSPFTNLYSIDDLPAGPFALEVKP